MRAGTALLPSKDLAQKNGYYYAMNSVSQYGGPKTPRYSIVSAVYNVTEYLDDFIRSIEAQDYPLADVEVIMVDDGSTDGSLHRLEAWKERRPQLVRVLSKANGGPASARNLGLEHATGQWVTFTDPDDTIAADYLSEVHAFLEANPETELVAANRRVIHEATGLESRHPLHRHFSRTNRLRNLASSPEYFHGHAPSAFFKRSVLDKERIRFDERIRPDFEDGHFCAAYLLTRPRPAVGFLTSAAYYYRKRSDSRSTLDARRADPRRYTDVLEFGYLDILRRSRDRFGQPPEWLQNLILFQLSWYFRDEESMTVGTAADEAADRFNPLLKAIAALLAPSVIEGFSSRRFDAPWRDLLLQLNSPAPWHTDFVVVDTVDNKQGLARVTYRYTGALPNERFFSDGVEVQPIFAKVRSFRYFDRTILNERIAWLPLGPLRVMLDGHHMNVQLEEPPPPVHALSRSAIRNVHDPLAKAHGTADGGQSRLDQAGTAAITRLSRSRLVRRFFKDAWVLMDRIDNADDNAEHLFRYLRRHKRGINAWFVLQRNSLDYERLRKDGYVRVVPHGSLRWKLLMLNARHLISSHADQLITQPPEILKLCDRPTWRLTFLQHGVIKDDLSNWLNRKGLDLFITSTSAEQRSIVADGTNYRYTDREVKLTGLPRFDRLREIGAQVGPAQRDYILIAPTWRNWLEQVDPITKKAAIDLDVFLQSEFAANWLKLIKSESLRNLAAEHACTVAVLLHPNLQPLTEVLKVPEWVKMVTFAGQDVQETFARARVLVTDYSSMAFNAAYIERPVVYFQFDRQRVFRGGHLGRKGYFAYERDGFGPVAFTVEQAEEAITTAVTRGPSPQPDYLRRIEETFPNRDGGCCERVVKVIQDSTRRVPFPGREIDSTRSAGVRSLSEESVIEPFWRDGSEALAEPPNDMSSSRVPNGNQV